MPKWVHQHAATLDGLAEAIATAAQEHSVLTPDIEVLRLHSSISGAPLSNDPLRRRVLGQLVETGAVHPVLVGEQAKRSATRSPES